MKKILFILSLIVLSIVVSCAKKSENTSVTYEEKVTYPYQFVNSKIEKEGINSNKMDLFAYSGELKLETLKQFCRAQKDTFDSGTFYYVVIFDDAKYAVFPNSPFSSEYGLEEISLKHIRAIYTYNKVNGYSQLKYYDKNMFQSPPKSESI